MAISKLNFFGERDEKLEIQESTNELKLKSVYRVGGFTRGTGNKIDLNLTEKDIVEFVFEDDTVWLSNRDTIEEIFPEAKNRSLTDEGVFELPVVLRSDTQERGVIKTIALKLLKVFTKEILEDNVRDLAIDYEKKQLEGTSGLYILEDDFSLKEILTTYNWIDKPYLLFIHGTASSTKGSFDKLKSTDVWNNIRIQYGKRVLAFQHETLSKDPLLNAQELISKLPGNITLDIISHSRGGLIGDIINRYSSTCDINGFSGDEKHYLEINNRKNEISVIQEIEKITAIRNIKVNKFIRVACPASGTTLSSKRLDHLFNILFNLLGLAIGGAANPVYLSFKTLLSAVVDMKEDIDILPGLEAMNPESPFIAMLNNANTPATISNPLIVIAGNSKMSLKWQGLLVIVSKLFYLGKNDFVVDTSSMYNGAKRKFQGVQYFLDESPEASHFNYFENDKTRNILKNAILNDGNKLIPGFVWQEQQFSKKEVRNALLKLQHGSEYRDKVSGKKPIAVILPGIMGSNLYLNDEALWINYFKFITGSLVKLIYSPENKSIKASSLIETSYSNLADYLESKNYDVVTFPFDWRLPLNVCAGYFNNKIKELLQFGQPIKIIGHSMGGVLVRDFIINYKETWDKLNKSEGFRLLFLGAPLQGSFRIPYVMFGEDDIIKTLSRVDLFHTKQDLLDVFKNMPGLLCLLPLNSEPENDFASRNTWLKMKDAFQGKIDAIPSESALNEFGQYRDNVNKYFSKIDFQNAVYIAGQSRAGKRTIKSYKINNKILEFIETQEGDESVTWESGIPPQMIEKGNVYYSSTHHGELANDKKGLFEPIFEILEKGSTSRLEKTRPALRGAEIETVAKASFNFDLSPRGVENSLLGLSTEENYMPGNIPIGISVSNGDLKFSTYPILAGHFYKDGLFSAEKVIDRYLDNELEKRIQLGLYPGEIGTNEILISRKIQSAKNQKFKGSIIIGLGKQGELTSYLLSLSTEQAILKYLIGLNNSCDPINNAPKTIGISALLIASGYGGLSIENATRSIISGIQNANNKIRNIDSTIRTVDEIEFIELFMDRALSCVHAIQSIEGEESSNLNIFWKSKKIKKLPGYRDRMSKENTSDWWTRLSVRKLDEEECKKKGLRFSMSTVAAREEERLLLTKHETILELLKNISVENHWSPELAKTLFELLIPVDFKEQIKRQNNIFWILDDFTAAYPWELLQDGLINAKPLSINSSMIRQLSTKDYRMNVNQVVSNTALVIGDPFLDNPNKQLPGALKEARNVSVLLNNSGYTVNSILQGNTGEILVGLFSKEYKIIHLAGHGEFNADPELSSGMLIGKDAILTPNEINQMSVVPELVFVNCCFLGSIDMEAEKYQQNRNKLAANIGTQLISIGVKAVVVAGWAVDDAAALDFAEEFYKFLFAGNNFGEATKKARRCIYDKYHEMNNTWGAYQCYGDPFYKIESKSVYSRENYEFTIPEEVEIELSNLQNQLDTGNYNEIQVINKVQNIIEAADKADISSGKITELQAMIYSDINNYGLAIESFKKLFKDERSAFTGEALAKYSTVRIKQLLIDWQLNNAHKYVDEIDKIILEIKFILGYGATSDRLTLLGSAYKRKAMMLKGKEKEEAYMLSSENYKSAYLNSSDNIKFYPLSSWLSLEFILHTKDRNKWKKEALEMLENQLKLNAINRNKDDSLEYWSLVGDANIKLCMFIYGEKDVTYEDVLTQYLDLWNYSGHHANKQSEIDYMDFLLDLFTIKNVNVKKVPSEQILKLKASLIENI